MMLILMHNPVCITEHKYTRVVSTAKKWGKNPVLCLCDIYPLCEQPLLVPPQ